MPSEELLTAIGNFNEEMAEAGIGAAVRENQHLFCVLICS